MRRAREKGHEVLDEALDRLYRAPPSRFVVERKAIVAELRARGVAAASAEIARARRPSPTAWAVNQVAFAHPDVLRAFGEAVEKLRAAQGSAFSAGSDGPSRFAAARVELKERARDVVQAAREAMNSEKLGWTPEAQRRVAQTLHAIPFASPEDRARLLAGRLDRDLDAAADFGALAGEAPAEDGGEKEKEHKKTKKEEKSEEKKNEPDESETQARARREGLERARVEAKERALARARRKKLVARARAAQKEAERLEAQAVKAESAAAKARTAADAARAAAVEAHEAPAESAAG